VLFPAWWHVQQHLHRATHPHQPHVSNHTLSLPDHGINSFRSGFDDHLANIATLNTYQNGQADLQVWKRRVDYLAAQPGITDIRVDMPASEVTTYSKGHLLWNKMNMNIYGLCPKEASKHCSHCHAATEKRTRERLTVSINDFLVLQ
jgi:hypothetical protein